MIRKWLRRWLGVVPAFNFTCVCGRGLCAEVPRKVGDKIRFDCECDASWELEWMNDHFDTRMLNLKGCNAASNTFVDQCAMAAENLRDEPVEMSGAYVPDEAEQA